MVQDAGLSYIKPESRIKNTEGEFLARVTRFGWILLAICSLVQGLFHASLVNLIAVGAVVIGWLILVRVFLRISMLSSFPLSTFLVIAFVSTQLYFPLVFTTLEGKPLVYNLELPELVFFHTIAALVVLTLFHAFYRLLTKLSNRRSFSILSKLGFFTPPSDMQLWAMGLLGILATFYVYFTSPEAGWEVTGGSAADKLVQGLMPFSYAPFFIPFGILYGNNQKHSRRLAIFLLLFTVALFAVSIGRNSRGAFMFGFTSVGFAYGLGLLLGVFKTRLFTFRNAVVAGLVFWLLVGPIADLGTAMVIVRGERGDVSADELIGLTLEAYSDKDAIAARRLEDNDFAPEPDWDERYLDNIFIARFSNIKFNDMSLVQFSKLREYDPDMLDYSIDYILSQFPEPVLQRLGLDVDKESVLTLSFGDYIYLAAGGYGYAYGYRTGHFAGTGMATFGYWYLLLLGIGMVPVFWLFDKFFMKKNTKNTGESTGLNYQFSFCGMLALTSIFQFLPPESVVNIGVFLIRGYIQLIFLYFIMFHITRILTGSITSKAIR